MDSWLDIGLAACDHAGLPYQSIETLVTWDQEYCANAIYRLEAGHYLKIFGPTAERQFHVERSVLRTLEEHPMIPAPRIVSGGERPHAHPYLILTALPGETAEEVWDPLPRTAKLAIAGELGALTAAIHRLPQAGLAAVERRFGGRQAHVIQPLAERRRGMIEAAEHLSLKQRDALLHFLLEEAPACFEESLRVTHFDLAHNHIYLSQQNGAWRVTGLLDWGEAVLGPLEWDVVYLWHWTFTTVNRDKEAMRACLRTLFDGRPVPERFARRCLAANLYTPSMGLLWPGFAAQAGGATDIVRAMTEFFYPPDVFGPPE